MSVDKVKNSTEVLQRISDLFHIELGNTFNMNKYGQWSHLNETNDGFYADFNKEVLPEEEVTTQIMSSQEAAALFDAGANKNNESFSSPQAASNNLYQKANTGESSSSSVPSVSAPRPPLKKGANVYDEYYEMHMKCIYGKSNKGMNVLINNYKAVLHALCGCKVSSELGPVSSADKYLNCYNVAYSNLSNHGRVLLGNTYGIFEKLPNYEIPPQVLAQLQLNSDNYSISKKVLSKAKNAKANEELEERILIGKLINHVKCWFLSSPIFY
jgi:hypothetical protein